MKSKRGEKIIEHETTLLNEKKMWMQIFEVYFSMNFSLLMDIIVAVKNIKGEID